jgi:hypothetical protein
MMLETQSMHFTYHTMLYLQMTCEVVLPLKSLLSVLATSVRTFEFPYLWVVIVY